jgi:hypothetical protein
MYNDGTLLELHGRNVKGEKNGEITEQEFVNAADLTQLQLFMYNNSFKVVPQSLMPVASKILMTQISSRIIKSHFGSLAKLSSSHKQSLKTQDMLTKMVEVCKQFNSPEIIDRILVSFSLYNPPLDLKIQTFDNLLGPFWHGS